MASGEQGCPGDGQPSVHRWRLGVACAGRQPPRRTSFRRFTFRLLNLSNGIWPTLSGFAMNDAGGFNAAAMCGPARRSRLGT